MSANPSSSPLAPEVFDLDRWDAPLDPSQRASLQDTVEQGRVLILPRLAFRLTGQEQALCDPRIAQGRAKNISFDPGSGSVSGAAPEAGALLKELMMRFAAQAATLIHAVAPSYMSRLEVGRTSFRPLEIAGRRLSLLKDDSLLHVDAFPSRPVAGRRILRVFANINPAEQSRKWTVGEPFDCFAPRFLPRVGKFPAWRTALLAAAGITKERRTAYDHLMLGLHNAAKRDPVYQAEGPRRAIDFPAGSTWVCFSDQVVHAAHDGQFALEQTFYLPPAAMAAPDRAPLSVLARLTGRRLI